MAATVTGAATNGRSVVVLSNVFVLFGNGSSGGDTWPDCVRVDSVSSDELLLTVLICRNVFVIVHLNPFCIRDHKFYFVLVLALFLQMSGERILHIV